MRAMNWAWWTSWSARERLARRQQISSGMRFNLRDKRLVGVHQREPLIPLCRNVAAEPAVAVEVLTITSAEPMTGTA